MLCQQNEIFGVYVYQFAAAQQSNALKLPAFFLGFQTEERLLRVNKSKITGENTFNGDHFDIEGNHESSKDKKSFVLGIFADL